MCRPDDEKKKSEEEWKLVEAILNSGSDVSDELLMQLFAHCRNRIRYYAMSFKTEEGEITQELFLRLVANGWERLREFNGSSSLSTWLSAIIYRLCIDMKRKVKRQPRTCSLEPSMADKNATEPPMDQDLTSLLNGYSASDVNDAFVKLSEYDQFILNADRLDGMTVNEIAELLSKDRNTIKVGLYRARKRLRENLVGNAND